MGFRAEIMKNDGTNIRFNELGLITSRCTFPHDVISSRRDRIVFDVDCLIGDDRTDHLKRISRDNGMNVVFKIDNSKEAAQ
ncbi:hypothetical protein HOF56_03740 [Candidatus Peribacteria bacterium]|jgi:hypothetical protein|nr:hypothetical protein [Candidatus Peribacteria bacterium]MBT4020878.1 hypothetical protein [Candidatus Peribacteria bacterium]MBT4241076.1 hypothetical protein [Candidatus Peribacteria bacterium]MBT4474425.1 hypothetical protein [Candidatus Peribacteria bacterium]